ncbi:isoprenylcysteine carboxylmethyltransferase family protein [Photobacterium japonica]|uniref:methyltransferase family protein n=1 Tax=Photobacterium japonica TaxID=2910235 RepID=UPI003D0E2AA3
MTLALKVPPLLVTAIVAGLMIVTGSGASVESPNSHALDAGTQLWLACWIWAAAVTVILLAVISFKRHQTTVNPYALEGVSTLVDSGIFRYSRNPMYVAMAMSLLGIAVLQGASLSLFYVAGFIIYITQFQIKPEEAFLQERFGVVYVEYCQQVRRWL